MSNEHRQLVRRNTQSLPPSNVHCSRLAADSLRAADFAPEEQCAEEKEADRERGEGE